MPDVVTTWTPIDTMTDFRDDSAFSIDPKTKQVQVIVEQPIVAGENLSQFIKFQMPRYYDAIDLTGMNINILYESPTGYTDINAAVNAEYNDEYIRFGWLVPYLACPEKGTLYFAVEFVGTNYTLKTVKSQTEVLESISGSTAVPEPAEQTWYITLQQQVSETFASANSALAKVQDIFDALGTPNTAETAADMEDQSKVYVYVGEDDDSNDPELVYGDWYYYDTTNEKWADGGVYASTALYTDQTPTQGSTNAVSSGGVYDALSGKVAKPLTSPNGTSGQLLQSLGNGNTQWTDYGLPTDAQVTEIFGDWLDEHPEATTTVQDWSLTAEKFVKGELGYITPQMFGAVCDGITDDAQAIQDAIDYAMANNCAVYFPSGTYAVSPQSIDIMFTGNDSLVMYGDGKTSCIKRMDESLEEKWDRIFLVNNKDATADSGLLYIHDLYFDSNRRNQSNATMDYSYEASAEFLIYFSNVSGYSLDTALFENLWFYDGVADHLDFTGTGVVHIKNIIINKVFTSGRQGTRNDIDFPGIPMENVIISNVICQRIHIEHNGTPTDPQNYFFTNVVCEEFTCPAYLGRFKVSNLIVNKVFVFGCRAGYAQFNNCEFNFKGTYSYIISDDYVSTILFNNCVFNSYDVDEPLDSLGTYDCTHLYLRRYLNIKFAECVFDYKGEYSFSTKTLFPVAIQYISGNDTVDAQHIVFNGCDFSKKFTACALSYGCGTMIFENMDIETNRLTTINTTNGLLNITFKNINFNGSDLFLVDAVKTDTCEFHGIINCKFGSIKMDGGSSNQHTRIKGDLQIIQPVTSPLTKTLLDAMKTGNYFKLFPFLVFVYVGDGKEAYPEKWECITNATIANSAFNNERRFKSIGSGLGATADRPSCILSPGFRYFDTTLGKPIFWNGTGWVDSTGTAV